MTSTARAMSAAMAVCDSLVAANNQPPETSK